ncbi:competence/damage-inducible protein A [Streptococcus equi]|uniref:competence/damage-inducible protein A n=1 Tax=Streptococcus equi TaxID=1336 RepID=UPI001E370642|nr:competence/damage-inducible protein A [Streptococcus equi]MCD3441220.1 competence/damage-inducible protein A [Streptococcus equi subsp. zooepidemicus]
MKAELIAVGTEILTGQIVNTNAQFLSEKMAELGIDVYFQTAVGDNEERLLSVIDIASQRSDLVILCGGLGPTDDDLTKQTLAKYLGKALVFDEQAGQKLDAFFAHRKHTARTPNNQRQAQLIEGSVALQNQTDPTIAPYAKTGEVTLRLSTKADHQALANERLDQLELQLLSIRTIDNQPLRRLLYGYGEDNSLARETFELLKRSGKTITAAESLTAGLFQAQLTDFAGASQVFNGGFITYSIEEKARMLGIPLVELQRHGVVSSFTAEQMAAQARCLTDSDIGIGLTGVAGPEALEGQPAGTVFIGLATKNKVESLKVVIGGRSRLDVRYIATLYAFNMVRKTLLKSENLL